jgi:UDP-N-acetylmuramate--alanine ligase
MIAHILRHSGYGCNAFLGGIALTITAISGATRGMYAWWRPTNMTGASCKLSPDIAVITAMDADHLDIYGTADAVQQAFIEFSGRLKTGGLLLSKEGS